MIRFSEQFQTQQKHGRAGSAVMFFMLCLLATCLGRGIFNISGSIPSIGNLARAFLPAGVCIIALLAFSVMEFRISDLRFRWRDVNFKHAPIMVLVGFVVGISPLPYLGNLLHVGELLVVAGGLATAVFLVFTRNDGWGMIVYMMVEPFISYMEWDLAPSILPEFLSARGTLSILCLLIFSAAVFFRLQFSGAGSFVRTPLDKYVFGFVGILLLSSVVSPDPGLSLGMWLKVGLVMPLFFFIVTNCIRTREDLLPFVVALVVRSFLRTSLIFYRSFQTTDYDLGAQFYTHGDLLARSLGAQAVNVALGIPIAISLAVALRRTWMVMALPAFVALFLTGMAIDHLSRGLQLSILLPVPIMLLYPTGKKVLISILGVLAILVAITGFSPILFWRWEILGTLGGLHRESSMRVDAWFAALEIMRDHPFFGVGLGMWPEIISKYGIQWSWQLIGGRLYFFISDAHNIFLNYGAEAGIGAFLLLVSMVTLAVARAIRLAFKANDETTKIVAIGSSWAILSLSFGLCLGGTFGEGGWIDHGLVFWVSLGLAMAIEKVDRSKEDI